MSLFDWGDPLFLALVAAVATAVAQLFFRQALLTLSASATTATVNGTMVIGGAIALAVQGGVAEWAPMGLVWFEERKGGLSPARDQRCTRQSRNWQIRQDRPWSACSAWSGHAGRSDVVRSA